MYKVVYFDRNADCSERYLNFSAPFSLSDAQEYLSKLLKVDKYPVDDAFIVKCLPDDYAYLIID